MSIGGFSCPNSVAAIGMRLGMRLDSLRSADTAPRNGLVQDAHGPLVLPQIARPLARQPQPSALAGVARAVFSKGALLMVALVAAWEFVAESKKKPSYLVGSMSGSMQAATADGMADARASLEGKVEAAKLAEQARYMPVIEAYKLAYQNCAVQTQAVAQAQTALIGARTALADRTINSRVGVANMADFFGALASLGDPQAGAQIREAARLEGDAALAEFDRRAGSAAPQIRVSGVCGESPAQLMERLAIPAPEVFAAR
jgi:hypothetical protein